MGFAHTEHFSRGALRNYVIVFGTLFNNLTVERKNAAGTRVQTIQVPLSYAPKEKMLARVNSDPNLDKKVAIQLPRMGFELTDLSYNGERILPGTNRYRAQNQSNRNAQDFVYEPVAYDLSFQLHIAVRNANDGVEIVEQILPYFRPAWTVSVITDSGLGISRDIPIVLQSVVSEDVYDGDFESRRALVWTLTFSMKAYLYGPTKTSDVIKKTIIDLSTSTVRPMPRQERLTVTPGLTTSNTPTSNSLNAVDFNLVKATDNFGFVETLEFFEDGSVRIPYTGEDS